MGAAPLEGRRAALPAFDAGKEATQSGPQGPLGPRSPDWGAGRWRKAGGEPAMFLGRAPKGETAWGSCPK